VEHAELVRSMREPEFYDHPVDRVELIQTHISSIFLTGELVYKLKKPVDFGFLDFSTIEKRQVNCEAELELNRRLAPDVYLRVLPITDCGGRAGLGADGEVLDWVVVMRQLDGDRLGPVVHRRGELCAELIDRVVDILVPFYERAATGPGIDEYGRIDVVRFNNDENYEQTAAFVGRAIQVEQYDTMRVFTDTFVEQRRDLLLRRIAEGRIREGHGDLHLGNIFFVEAPVIFDCIEFNPRLRNLDVACDLAFLVMDLDFRGRSDLARGVVSRYVELSGDHELPELMDFYCGYRAYVRGKIACLTSTAPELDEAAVEQQIELARAYFALAHRYAQGEVG
jgi:aminoglycoside phosphotransferase family enzyme